MQVAEYSKIKNYIMNLPEKDRILLALFYYENFSIEEIAYILEQQEKKVKNRICYLQNRIKQMLEE